eukprot:3424941-Amphidinium_carterae.1
MFLTIVLRFSSRRRRETLTRMKANFDVFGIIQHYFGARGVCTAVFFDQSQSLSLDLRPMSQEKVQKLAEGQRRVWVSCCRSLYRGITCTTPFGARLMAASSRELTLKGALRIFGVPAMPAPDLSAEDAFVKSSQSCYDQHTQTMEQPEEWDSEKSPADALDIGASDDVPAPRADRTQILVRKVLAEGATTLQIHGLGRYARVENVVLLLHIVGLRGCYNYVSIPRHIHGHSLGYAFVNFTAPDHAARMLQMSSYQMADYACLARAARITIATKQGYAAYVTARVINKFKALRNTTLWPLVMTEDGLRPHFGSDESIAAAAEESL